MRQFDSSGLDALDYFKKCLDSWPKLGLNFERRGTRGGTFKAANNGNTYLLGRNSVGTESKVLPSPLTQSTPIVALEPYPSTIFVGKDPKLDLEMGQIRH